jgi:hypothetical protein
MALFLAGILPAAQVSFSNKAPTAGPVDIANLQGANLELNNVSDGDNDATYLADDRPVQGQTFTTGTNAAGYVLRAVALREAKHETYALVPDLKYTVRVTKPAGKSLEILTTETVEVAATTAGNFQTIADGEGMGTGSGSFIIFTFAKPVALKPSTIYGFDVGGGKTRHYWQTDGIGSNTYAGGEAYSSGSLGAGSDTRTARSGDHVFVVTLAPASEAGTAGEKKALQP